MKKFKWAIALLVVLLFGTVMFVACAPKEPEEKTHTVTYYDGETVLKTEQVKERGKAPFLLCGISVRAIPPVHVVDILGNREYCKW